MHTSTLLGAIALLAATVTSTPVSSRQASPDEFFLQTSGSPNADFNGLYIYAYHTGAGTSDAVGSTSLTVANQAGKAFLNDSTILFDLSPTVPPYGFILNSIANYGNWESVVINAGEGTTDMSFNADNELVWNNAEFGGWLICNWYHEAPQLFWLFDEASPADVSSNCATVNVLRTPITTA